MVELLWLGLIYLLLGLFTLVLAAMHDATTEPWCSECHNPLRGKKGEPSLIFFFWPVAWFATCLSLIDKLYYRIACGWSK